MNGAPSVIHAWLHVLARDANVYRVANRNGHEYHLPKINFAVRTCPIASTLPVLYCLHTDV